MAFSRDPLHKRRRVYSTESGRNGAVPAVRDDAYYHEDGDCIFLVENTLFKLHRFLLSRDSSAFGDMFSLDASRGAIAEGTSDAQPIILPDTSARLFRVLLRALYAMPQDLEEFNLDIEALLNVAEVANKYHFVSLCRWALDKAKELVPFFTDFERKWKPVDLQRCLEVAVICQDSRLQDMIAETWANGLLKEDLNPADALNTVVQHVHADASPALRRLKGAAFYQHLMVFEGVSIPSNTPHALRLLTGYRALVHEWDSLSPSGPPPLKRLDNCRHHSLNCIDPWTAAWAHALQSFSRIKPRSAALLGNWRCLETWMRSDISSLVTTSECRSSSFKALSNRINNMHEEFADFFV